MFWHLNLSRWWENVTNRLARRIKGDMAMLLVKTWSAEVAAPQTDLAGILKAQADFIMGFMGPLFADMDAHRLGARSAHFHRLGEVVRFRVLGEPAAFDALVADVKNRLNAAQAAGLIKGSSSEAESEWENPGNPTYGTDIAGVARPFCSIRGRDQSCHGRLLEINQEYIGTRNSIMAIATSRSQPNDGNQARRGRGGARTSCT